MQKYTRTVTFHIVELEEIEREYERLRFMLQQIPQNLVKYNLASGQIKSLRGKTKTYVVLHGIYTNI